MLMWGVREERQREKYQLIGLLNVEEIEYQQKATSYFLQ